MTQPTTPEGWKMVPVEPTEEMNTAYFDAHAKSEFILADAPEVWAEMLSASPSPPVGGGSDTSTSKLQSHARQDAGAQAAPPDWFVRRFMEHRHFYAAHKIDIVARKDGKEYRLEGDWLKDVVKGMAGVDVNHGAESQNDGQHQRTTTPADPHPLKHLLDQAAPFIEATNADRKSIEPPPPDAHGTEPSKPEAVMPADSPCATSAAAQSWQPIETAPKDGRWILGWMPSKWEEERIQTYHWSDDHPAREGYWCDAHGQNNPDIDGQPTHWQPLLAPPADSVDHSLTSNSEAKP